MRRSSAIAMGFLPVAGILGLTLLNGSAALAANIYSVNSWDEGNVSIVDPSESKYVGFKFSVTSNTWINSLAAWVESSAFTGIHDISLWDVTDNSSPALPEIFVAISGGAAPADPKDCTFVDYFCSKPVAAYELLTGKTYSLSASYMGAVGPLSAQRFLSALTTGGGSPQVTLNPVFTYIENTISDSSEDPPLDSAPIPGFGNVGPNLGLGGGPTSSVPAPLPLLGASAALAYSRRIKSRINAAQ